MSKKKSTLKKAHKNLKFWFEVLLSTDLMNDVNDRNDFKEALNIIKQYSKKQSGT
jgi:hypothetical protein